MQTNDQESEAKAIHTQWALLRFATVDNNSPVHLFLIVRNAKDIQTGRKREKEKENENEGREERTIIIVQVL